MPKGKKFNEERGNGSSKSVKARIRDIRRLLKRDDLVATVRVEKERMLEMLESDLKEKQNQELEKKLTEKYKMVKFFERRKITRKITAAEKKIAAEGTTAEEIQEAQANIEEYKRQLNYVVYFPKLEPYVSILTTEPLSEKGAATRTEIYDSINKAVADRNLPQITTHNPTKALFDPKNRNGHAKSTQQAKPQNKDKKDKSEPETAKMEEGGFNDLFFVLDKAGDNSQQDADTLADAPVVKNSSKKRAIIGGKEGEGISSDHTKKRKIKELVKSHKKSKGAQ